MTTNGWVRLLSVGALVVTLAGCTDSQEATEKSAPPDDATSASPGVTPEESTSATAPIPSADGPADELEQTYTVPVGRTRGLGTPYGTLGPVFTDDLVLYSDRYDFLHAIDRATGAERWRVKRRFALDNGDTPCSLTHPTPDAEVVVFNHGGGQACGNFTVYSLADGAITEKYDSVTRVGRRIRLELPYNSDLVAVGGRTYFLDADSTLLRLEADGTTTSVGSPVVLPGDGKEWHASDLVALPGSDVMMTRLVKPTSKLDLDEDENGKLIGFRINDSDLPELVWEQDLPALMSKASSPGHVRGVLDVFSDVDGAVVDEFRRGSRPTIRYRVIDPATGDLSSPGYTYDAKNPPFLPGFALAGGSVPAGDSTIFTPTVLRGSRWPGAVVRLDFASGKTMWTWTIPGTGRPGQATSADVVSTSADGSLVYVRTTVGLVGRLWELDASTGEAVRNWKFSNKLPGAVDLVGADVIIDGGDVFRLLRYTPTSKVMAAMYR